MISINPGLYVTIEEMEGPPAPAPRPLEHGFSPDTAYLVLGAFSLSESGEAFFILSNDEDQIWFISNRHLRTHQFLPESTALRFPLSAPSARRSKDGARNGYSMSAAR